MLNIRDLTVHIINVVPSAVSTSSVKWSAYPLKGVILGSGEIPCPGDQIDGNTVAHLEGSLPWVDSPIANSHHGVQAVLIYRLALTYVQRDGKTSTADNSYYLTDPSANGEDAQSRFSLLGAMRKENPRVNLDVHCTMASGVECTLKNTRLDVVAIMIKLTLVRSPPTNFDKSKENRILPTLFSDNYITLLPGDTSRVHVSAQDMELSKQDFLWKCSHNRSVQAFGNASMDLMLSVDGWNVEKRKVPILCEMPSSVAS